jgi:hypothetical protein
MSTLRAGSSFVRRNPSGKNLMSNPVALTDELKTFLVEFLQKNLSIELTKTGSFLEVEILLNDGINRDSISHSKVDLELLA